MGFKEEAIKAVEKIEDEAIRATVLNEVEQAYSLDVGGLKEAKETILKEKKELESKFNEVNATLEGLGGKTIEDFKALETSIADLTKDPGDKGAVVAELKKAAQMQLENEKNAFSLTLASKDSEIAERELTIANLNQEINNGLAQQQLVDALERVNVKAELKPMLTKALQNDVSVEEDSNGNRVVKFKHNGVKFDILDGVGTWAGDKANNSFIGAIRNAGAGANGSNGRGSGRDKPFNELTYAEEVSYFKRDPEGYKQAKANATK